MLTVREKLAAIRAKREARSGHPVKLQQASISAAEPTTLQRTPEKPQRSDKKSKDDDLETTPMKKLLTPTRVRANRHTPRTSRLLWRHSEMQRARKLAARNVMDSDSYSFMTAAIPDEEKTPIKQPDFNQELSRDAPSVHESEPVDDAKEGKNEEEEEEGDDTEDLFGDEDEEERALQSAEQDDYFSDAGQVHANGDSIDPVLDVSNSKSGAPRSDKDISATDDATKDNNAHVKEAESEQASQAESLDGPPSEGPLLQSDENQISQEEIKEEEATEDPASAPTQEDTATNTCPPTSDDVLEKASLETSESHGTPAVYKPAVYKSIEPQRLNFALVDEEAEEDEKHQKRDEQSVAHFTDDEGDDGYGGEVCDDDEGITPDVKQKGKEVAKMAHFHRQWEMEAEQTAIEAATGRERHIIEDDDEPMDMSGAPNPTGNQTGNSDDACNVDGGVANEGSVDCSDHMDGSKRDEKMAASEKYMEVMFRRDDSRSKAIDNVENTETEDQVNLDKAKREQQRALWKARQKFKEQVGQTDENSLSHFNLFADGENNRSHNIRKKLESSCRPASRLSAEVLDKLKADGGKGKKRAASELAENTPEWVKKKECMERRQRKRQRAVSVGNWSGDREKAPTTKPTKNSAAARVSLGASFLIRKNRAADIQAPRTQTRRTRGASSVGRGGRSRPPTSFKGLLNLLGKQAEMDT